MLFRRCTSQLTAAGSRQKRSTGTRIASGPKLKSFSVNASTVKKLDLASASNDYISSQFGTDESLKETLSSDLEVYPDFMTVHEQKVLLSAALKKLDSMASREERKKRREWNKANKATLSQSELRGELVNALKD